MDLIFTNTPAIGRFLVGFFFFLFGFWNGYYWRPTLDFMHQKRIPLAALLLGFGIIFQIVTGFMLMIGVYVKIAALLLIPFDIIAVLIFHAFWNFTGEVRRLNTIVFIANLTASLGALLLLLGQLPRELTVAFFLH